MAEILVRVVAHAHSTPQTADLHIGPYEAVVVRENGWPWSQTELNNPAWRIIQIPNVTAAGLAYFAQSANNLGGVPLKKRKWKIDLTAPGIAAIVAQWLQGKVNVISPGDRNKLINAIVVKT